MRQGLKGVAHRRDDAKWVSRGLCLVTGAPLIAYTLAFFPGADLMIPVADGSRASRTVFPGPATVFIWTSVAALMASVFASVKLSVSLPIEKLQGFEAAVMLKQKRVGREQAYSRAEPFVLIGTLMVCLALLIHGPVDLAILSAMGVVVSGSPVAFVFTQMQLVLLAYAVILCLSLWVAALIRLRRDPARLER